MAFPQQAGRCLCGVGWQGGVEIGAEAPCPGWGGGKEDGQEGSDGGGGGAGEILQHSVACLH